MDKSELPGNTSFTSLQDRGGSPPEQGGGGIQSTTDQHRPDGDVGVSEDGLCLGTVLGHNW